MAGAASSDKRQAASAQARVNVPGISLETGEGMKNVSPVTSQPGGRDKLLKPNSELVRTEFLKDNSLSGP